VEAMKDTITGDNLYEKLSTICEWYELSWNKLITATTDGSQNLKSKNIGLIKDGIYYTWNVS
jgi:hypothetical protein